MIAVYIALGVVIGFILFVVDPFKSFMKKLASIPVILVYGFMMAGPIGLIVATVFLAIGIGVGVLVGTLIWI